MKNLTTTQIETITNNLNSDKEFTKNLKKLNYYDVDRFIYDALQYIDAIENQKMLCVIKIVSSSGMSRVLNFNSFVENADRSYYRNYVCLFIALGYSESKNKDGIRIGGCGMDMVFHTNYTIIHRLTRYGFLDKKECDILAQKTPVVL